MIDPRTSTASTLRDLVAELEEVAQVEPETNEEEDHE